jgi:hemerythrin-like domain-containing protein
MFRQIGQKPPSGYSDPVGMMEDCHQRIRFFLGTLSRIGDTSDDGKLEAQRAEALRNAVAYFRTAAPRHNADEEDSLFPRLRGLSDSRVSSIESTLQCLEGEHARADAAQNKIHNLAQRWLESGSLSEADRGEWRSLVEELSAHYEQHMAVEERLVFTLAKQILSASQQQQIGQEMARRRGAELDLKP